LDHTHTWGRTYWGGALFWFLADLEIREKTENKKSLDDAIVIILKKGGDGSHHWSPDEIFKTGDEALGISVLTKMHESTEKKPMTPILRPSGRNWV